LLHNEEITFNESSGMISVFALDEEVKGVDEINLKYELSKATLTNCFPLGVSNEFIKGKKAKIKIEEGHLLIVAPLDSISL
jgi:thiamine pyrophosphokinase